MYLGIAINQLSMPVKEADGISGIRLMLFQQCDRDCHLKFPGQP